MEVPMTKVSWKRQTKGQMKNINDILNWKSEMAQQLSYLC